MHTNNTGVLPTATATKTMSGDPQISGIYTLFTIAMYANDNNYYKDKFNGELHCFHVVLHAGETPTNSSSVGVQESVDILLKHTEKIPESQAGLQPLFSLIQEKNVNLVLQRKGMPVNGEVKQSNCATTIIIISIQCNLYSQLSLPCIFHLALLLIIGLGTGILLSSSILTDIDS